MSILGYPHYRQCHVQLYACVYVCVLYVCLRVHMGACVWLCVCHTCDVCMLHQYKAYKVINAMRNISSLLSSPLLVEVFLQHPPQALC